MARTKVAAVPEVGDEAPEFHLPSAQGGQLRLSMRTVRGPVVVVFYRGPDSEEDVEYFKALAEKEDEINLAAGSVVGIGVAEPWEARELLQKSGIKSYILYDYARVASRDWGLLEKDRERGEYARPAVFIVGPDRKVVEAWVDERPEPAELLAKVSEITGLPRSAEEKPEKPGKAKPDGEAADKPERPRLSPEEREKRRAERKAAREAGETPEAKKPKAEKAPESGGETGSPAETGERRASADEENPSAGDGEGAEPEEKKTGE